MMQEYERKTREDKAVIALCYDFDMTLSPEDMKAQGYIQDLGLDVESFWEETNAYAKSHGMDAALSAMYKMVREAAKSDDLRLTREVLENYGAKVELFLGVEDWFARINAYGRSLDVMMEHYIISAGMKEMIDGTSIAKAGVFEKIYASSFAYDENGDAVWPAQAINPTNKTQFLFRIEKGILDVNDPGECEYIPERERRVPFRNMIYIGDSFTDIPCMRIVNKYGGYSIGVYDPKHQDKRQMAELFDKKRIRYFAPADYREGSELDRLVKAIIAQCAAQHTLVEIHEHDDCEAKRILKHAGAPVKKDA